MRRTDISSAAFDLNGLDTWVDSDDDGTLNALDSDDDEDGLPDSFENEFGLNPVDTIVDGVEVDLGSDPRNSASTPLTLQAVQGTLTLEPGLNAVAITANRFLVADLAAWMALLGGPGVVDVVTLSNRPSALVSCR